MTYKRLVSQYAASATYEEIVQSSELHAQLSALAHGVMEHGEARGNIVCQYAPQSNITAYTDGKNIHLNTGSDIATFYCDKNLRLATLAGMVFHECAHRKFHDFDADKTARDQLEKKHTLYGGLTSTPPEDFAEAIQNPAYTPIWTQLRHELVNCVIDAHDEEKMCTAFPGLVSDTIYVTAESLKQSTLPVERISELGSELSGLTALVLELARFETIICINEETAEKEPLAKTAYDAFPHIYRAVHTDSPEQMYREINEILLLFWPFIKKELENQQKQQEKSGSSGSSDSSSGGSSSGSSSGGSSPSQQSVQNTANAIGKGAGAVASAPLPRNCKSSANAKVQSKAASDQPRDPLSPIPSPKATSKNAPNDTGKMEKAANAMRDIANKVARSIGTEKAENEINSSIDHDILVMIQGSELTTSHKNVQIEVKRQKGKNEKDYQAIYPSIANASKRLQSEIRRALMEEEGAPRNNRYYGRNINASAMWRPDGRYFSDRKLPNDELSLAVSILVDLSGSMQGVRAKAAAEAATLLYDFCRGLKLPCSVLGHNCNRGYGGYKDDVFIHIFAQFDSVGKTDAYAIASLYKHTGGCNRDGAAITIAGNLLAKRPESKKLLLVISDGQPNASGYTGDAARKDMREQIGFMSRREGIETIAFAIGEDKENIRKIYGEGFVDINNLNALPRKMTQIVKRKLK